MKYGGVGIFVSKRLRAGQVYFNPSTFKDQVWVSIKLQGSDSLLVGCIYRSPSHPINISVTSLCELFTNLGNYTHLLVCGDFNFKEIVWSDLSGSSTNSHIVPFIDTIDDLFLFQHVSNPTRFRQDTTPNLLDLVFTNEKDMVTNMSYLPPLGKEPDNTRYNIRAADIDMMKATLCEIDWPSITMLGYYSSLIFKRSLINTFLPISQKKESACILHLKYLT